MRPKYIAAAASNAASLLLFAVMTIAAGRLARSLPDQRAAERWEAGETPYEQISVFTERSSAWDINDIFTARTDIEKKLAENSLAAERDGARVWADAFSGEQTKITVSTDRANAEANLIVTGGDFFLFHPFELISGCFYSEESLMQDGALIDDALAWQLYGSSDVAGMPITVDGRYYLISGVFRRSDDSNVEKAYGTSPRIFISYEGYGGDVSFTCYEACLPGLVSGQGAQMISEVFSIDDSGGGKKLVDNSGRYGIRQRFGIIRDLGTRSMVDSAVVYPFWENAARVTEDKSALLLALQILFLILPACTVLWLLGLLIKNRKKLLRKLWDKIKAARGTGKKPPSDPEPAPEREKIPLTAERN